MQRPVTFQVTVSPMDWRHAVHVLPHQLRQWAGQVDDVQLTLNLMPLRSRSGVTAASGLTVLREVLADLCRTYDNAHVVEVDTSDPVRADVAARFFDGRPVPLTNHDGGPFYSYFFGWHAARNDMVLHADSDMLFGGGSQSWVAEALALLDASPDVLCAAPLPGPPTSDGTFPDHIRARHARLGGDPERLDVPYPAYRLHGCSTRLWLFDRSSLSARLHGTPLDAPRLRSALRARLEGNPPFDLPERTITRRMNELGLRRVDLLGSGAGMWSLHPTMRSEEFYDSLKDVVSAVEQNDLPDAQRGDYNINDSLVDWTSARAAARHNSWYQRLGRRYAESLSHGLRSARSRRR